MRRELVFRAAVWKSTHRKMIKVSPREHNWEGEGSRGHTNTSAGWVFHSHTKNNFGLHPEQWHLSGKINSRPLVTFEKACVPKKHSPHCLEM